MLESFLNLRNYGFYNVSLANTLELKPAIYLQYLIIAHSEAVKKLKTMEDDSFRIQRSWIFTETTITKDEQLLFDKGFQALNILAPYPKGDIIGSTNIIKIYFDKINEVLETPENFALTDYYNLLHPVDTEVKVGNSKNNLPSKQDVMVQRCVDYLSTEIPELREAYKEWLNSVYQKQGWLNKTMVTAAERDVQYYSGGDLTISLKLLEVAAINGYRTINWAAKQLNLRDKPAIIVDNIITDETQLSEEVF